MNPTSKQTLAVLFFHPDDGGTTLRQKIDKLHATARRNVSENSSHYLRHVYLCLETLIVIWAGRAESVYRPTSGCVAGWPGGWVAGWAGGRVRFVAGQHISLLSTASRPSLQWLPGTPTPGAKRPGSEADHSPQCNAEIRDGKPPAPDTFSWLVA
jgi:hypothetical protein